mmetsp:Transcript_3273/g.10029  ORF Transcript_3273/g.10029 Transcript_3273/m.10029 type:complete len:555 (-) Transcript_3273:147-1811(-)
MSIHDRRNQEVKFEERSRRDSAQDGKPWEEEARGKEDKALLNLITNTAKKSSYNNSRRHGLGDTAGDNNNNKKARQKPARRRGLFGSCCGTTAGDAEAPSTAKSRKKKKAPSGSQLSEKLVLRDPTSKVSYNIEHLIGEGGFSKVLLVRAKSGHIDAGAEHVEQRVVATTTNGDDEETENGSVYAAKIIPKSHLKSAGESFIKATMLERNILGKFHHPFLLKLYHAFQERDRLILVIDYCPGGSLHTHVNISLREKGSGFDEQRAAFYVAEIALAMAHLHKHGIVHRDLKLENVLMYQTGHCAVSDFGASKRIKPMDPALCEARLSHRQGHHPESSDVSRRSDEGGGPQQDASSSSQEQQNAADEAIAATTKSIVGTPAYMSPEMLLTQPYDYSVDWWALGVVLFTMLKGRLPFDAPEEEKMLWRIVKSKPRYDPSWSQPLLDVLRALLQKRPTTRLGSLKSLSKHELYKATDWTRLERLQIAPPYVPSFNTDADTKYLPKRIAETALPTLNLDYKKGDSMKKLFRKFSHRGSFDSAGGSGHGHGGGAASSSSS